MALFGTVSSDIHFRNRIINGDMRIDQRNAGASVTPASSTYTLDRWRAFLSVTSKYSVQRSSVAPAGFVNSLLVTSLSSYSIGSSDFFGVQQRVEGFNFSDLGWGTANAQTVTLSFWVRSSLTGTFGGSLINGSDTRSYPFSYTISVANTWEYKTVIVEGDTTGTWDTTNDTGVKVGLTLGIGSALSGVAGAWAAGNVIAPTGSVSVVGTSGATWQITGVQLEAGSVATPFERRPFGTELALCQRYYVQGVINAGYLFGASSATAATPVVEPLPVEMRASPTLTAAFTSFDVAANAGISANTRRVLAKGTSTSGYNYWFAQWVYQATAEL